MMLITAATALLLAATGCGDFKQSVRMRAANDFQCPEGQIALSDAEPYAQPTAYLAEGCGKSQAYEGGCDLGGCLVEKVPSPEERAARNAGASRPGMGTTGAQPGSAAQPAETKPAEPTTPAFVSVSLRNECPNTVKVFYGDDPKFGSGTLSSLGGNSITNKSFTEGDMIWLVDDSRNGLGSVSVSRSTREVRVTKSCTGFVVD